MYAWQLANVCLAIGGHQTYYAILIVMRIMYFVMRTTYLVISNFLPPPLEPISVILLQFYTARCWALPLENANFDVSTLCAYSTIFTAFWAYVKSDVSTLWQYSLIFIAVCAYVKFEVSTLCIYSAISTEFNGHFKLDVSTLCTYSAIFTEFCAYAKFDVNKLLAYSEIFLAFYAVFLWGWFCDIVDPWNKSKADAPESHHSLTQSLRTAYAVAAQGYGVQSGGQGSGQWCLAVSQCMPGNWWPPNILCDTVANLCPEGGAPKIFGPPPLRA